MKKILFLFLISVTFLFSTELNYIKTFDEAKNTARTDNKKDSCNVYYGWMSRV